MSYLGVELAGGLAPPVIRGLQPRAFAARPRQHGAAREVHADEIEVGDVVVVKRRVSAFTGSDLEVVLRARQVGVQAPVNALLQRLAEQTARERRQPGWISAAEVLAQLD